MHVKHLQGNILLRKSKIGPAEKRPRYGRGSGIPHPIDVHVGKRIRTGRLLLGINQETLAAGLGLTFQQVQKYEAGANRVSASRLSAIADILRVPVSFFFEGQDDPLAAPQERALRDHLERPQTLELIRLYYAIPDERVRQQFLRLVEAVAEATARANARKSAVRSAVEHVLARQKGPMGLFVRTIGIARAKTKIGLANLVYNMQRTVWLAARPAAA
jgi:transcriptional regulator with XRE-family HTH domain